MNLGDVVGELIRQGMSPQTQQRVEHATGADGLGSATGTPDLGELLGGLLGGGSGSSGSQGSGGLGDVLGGLLGGAGSGSGSSGSQGSGGLGDVLGGLLGGAGGGQGSAGAGGLGDILGSVLGGAAGDKTSGNQASGGLGDILGGLGQILGAPSGVGGMSKGQVGGLGALAGAILGGGGSATKGAIGGSAMALLGTLALSALKNWQAQSASAGQAMGLTESEVKQIAAPQTAELCLRGMIEAMKADGTVSRDEIQRLTGKLSEGGITDEETQFVQGELAKPLDLGGLVAAIPNPEVGIQVYAAALMAISVDTPAEKAFLDGLASGVGLDRGAIARLHQMVGAPTA